MDIKLSKGQDKFSWTTHASNKMKHYQLSKSRVLRVFNNPERVEEGIAEDTTAVMQPTTAKHTTEIWLMYQKNKKTGAIAIISAWRFPGKSPVGAEIPVPEEIKRELSL